MIITQSDTTPDPLPIGVDVVAAPAAGPLLVDARRLAAMLGCGVRTVRTHDACGKLPMPIRYAGRVVWSVDDIRAWISAGCPGRDEWAATKSASPQRSPVPPAVLTAVLAAHQAPDPQSSRDGRTRYTHRPRRRPTDPPTPTT